MMVVFLYGLVLWYFVEVVCIGLISDVFVWFYVVVLVISC